MRRFDDEAHAAWDNIVSNRHGVAHEDDSPVVSNMTWRELTGAYPKALSVLNCLRASISGHEPEVAAEEGSAAATGAAPRTGVADMEDDAARAEQQS